jgi:hypothetical protein
MKVVTDSLISSQVGALSAFAQAAERAQGWATELTI